MGVRHWTATLETNKDGKHHLHLMVEFFKKVDRTAPYFAFEGRCPNARANDLLGEAWCGRRWQASVDRGHFYVYANKKGTVPQLISAVPFKFLCGLAICILAKS